MEKVGRLYVFKLQETLLDPKCLCVTLFSVLPSSSVLQMYSLLLEVQDFEKRFVQTPEEDREALLEQHKTNTVQLCNSLREKEWDDR